MALRDAVAFLKSKAISIGESLDASFADTAYPDEVIADMVKAVWPRHGRGADHMPTGPITALAPAVAPMTEPPAARGYQSPSVVPVIVHARGDVAAAWDAQLDEPGTADARCIRCASYGNMQGCPECMGCADCCTCSLMPHGLL
jgi:hypothetical protein